MNHIQILKRSWNILWSYKTLWVFGILLAFTAAEAGTNSNARIQGNVSPEIQQWQGFTPQQIEQMPEGFREAARELSREWPISLPPETVNAILGIAIALVCLALLAAVAMAVVRYISQTALIRMVDRYEASGEKVTWRAGFRLGWSRSAGRLFLIDLLIFLVLFVGIVTVLMVAGGPLLLSLTLGGIAPIAGLVTTVGLGLLALFVIILMSAVVTMLREVFYRECILRGRGVIDSIRGGISVLRANFKNLLLMWLLLLAIQFVYAVAMIPVAVILFAVGLVIGGSAGAVLYLALQAGSIATAIIVGIVTGVLLLIAVIGIPSLFLRGLRETYLSTAWTLAYREIPTSLLPAEPVKENAS
jgi:hypothetical protein